MIKKTRYIQTNNELGTKLKQARKKAELTQNQVSNIIGIDRSSISFYESGKTLPNIFMLIKLAKIYNTKVHKFITNN